MVSGKISVVGVYTAVTPSHHEDRPIDALGHDWNETYTTIADATETTDGVEAITCKHDPSHTKDSRFNGEYATGTAGLTYNYYSEYCWVNRGTATGAVFIPAYHRADADSPYVPVTYLTGFAGTYSAAPNTTLTSVRIPAGVTSLFEAFQYCTSLASVTFEEGIQLEDEYAMQSAFQYCTSLTSITIPASVKYLGPEFTASAEGDVFDGCTSLASVTFEEGSQLEVIGNRAFGNCTSLTSITIPASVRLLGLNIFPVRGPFNGCTSLASVTFEGTIPSSGFFVPAFPAASMGDLRDKYLAEGGGIGTYTREPPALVWTKQ